MIIRKIICPVQEPTGYPAQIRFGRISGRFCPIRPDPVSCQIMAGCRIRTKIALFGFLFQTISRLGQHTGWRSQYRSRAFGNTNEKRHVQFTEGTTTWVMTHKLIPRAVHNAELCQMRCSLYFPFFNRFKLLFNWHLASRHLFNRKRRILEYETDMLKLHDICPDLAWSGLRKTCVWYSVFDPASKIPTRSVTGPVVASIIKDVKATNACSVFTVQQCSYN